MIQITHQQDCCGCTACAQVCKKGAIKMERDEKGFRYPITDIALCNDCGLCEQTCPILHHAKESREPLHTYAVKHKNEQIRLGSSSGGVFTVLAQDTVRRGGVVYGAVFDKEWKVIHQRIDSMENLEKLRGSKYVQSDLGNIFSQVKKDLIQQLPVLFSGTPCQVAGLLSYLRKPYETLTTVDFVCHGVPNPRIWEEYLAEEAGSEVNAVSFRNKSHGWEKNFFYIAYRKNEQVVTRCTFAWEHTFMKLFLYDFISRPSCHCCRFRNGKSGADYTLGDYWAGSRFYPHFFDDKGVSLLLTYKKELPKAVQAETDYIETSFDHARYGNPALSVDWPRNPYSDLFYLCHDRLGMRISGSLYIAEHCLKTHRAIISFYRRWTLRIKSLIKKIIRWQK